MKYFFLILLIIVLIYLSVKPIEGFDASHNSLKVSVYEIEYFTNANIALFTIFFVIFILIAFIIIKLRSTNQVTNPEK